MSLRLRERAQRQANTGDLFFPDSDHTTHLASQPAVKPDPDLDQDEEEFEGEDGEAGEDDGTYEPKTAISEPISSQRRIGEIIRILNSQYLELSPDYQRGVVWNESRMTSLIESFIENFYIPPVIFNVVRIADEGGEPRYRRICVDGKQRLTSIREFLAGNIPVRDKHGRKWYYIDNGSGKSKRNILPESAKHEFRNKRLVCYEYQDMGREHEEDLFARVQEGVTLTAAEKLRATSGPWQTFIKIYEEDYADISNLIKNKRSSGFRGIAACFAQIVATRNAPKGRVPPIKSSESALEALFKQGSLLTDEAKEHFREVFDLYADLVRKWPQHFKEHEHLKHTRSFSPIEFSAVGVLLSVYCMDRGKAQLAKDVQQLRFFLRERFADLKSNTRTWEVCWRYIDRIQETRDERPLFLETKTPVRAKRNSGISQVQNRNTTNGVSQSTTAAGETDIADGITNAESSGNRRARILSLRNPTDGEEDTSLLGNGSSHVDGGAENHAQRLNNFSENRMRNLGPGLKKPKLTRFTTSEGDTGASGRSVLSNGVNGHSRGGLESISASSASQPGVNSPSTNTGARFVSGRAPIAKMGHNGEPLPAAQPSTPVTLSGKRRLAALENANDGTVKRTKGLAARPRLE